MNEITVLFSLALLGAVGGAVANFLGFSLTMNRRAISPWMRPLPGHPARTWADCVPIFGWSLLRREHGIFGRLFWLRPLIVEFGLAACFPLLFLQIQQDVSLRTTESMVVNESDLATDFPSTTALQLAANQRLGLHLLLLMLMTVATLTDFDEKIIPDTITIPSTIIGLFYVTCCPWSLLPDVFSTSPGALEPVGRLGVVWGWTPFSLPPGLVGRSLPALALGMACYWGWCFGLLNRRWRTKRGYWIAMKIFQRGILRDPVTWTIILPLCLVGSVGIGIVWQIGGLCWMALLTGLMGMAIGGGLVWAVRVVAGGALGVEALGFGDVTLMAMIGSMLGWQACWLTFFLSPFAAVAVAVVNYVLHQDNEIPFGPFLCLAALYLLFQWGSAWPGPRDAMLQLGWVLALLGVAILALMAVMLLGIRAFKSMGKKP